MGIYGRHRLRHFGLVDALRAAAGIERDLIGRQFSCHAVYTMVEGLCQGIELCQFLYRKRKPIFNLSIQILLLRQIHRHVEQRARGGQPQSVAQLRCNRA